MKTTIKRLNPVLALGVLVFISCTNDNKNTGTTGTDTAIKGYNRESKEADFVTDALKSSTTEIAWLKAGINKGTDNEVKSTATKMLLDHETLTSELKDYAQTNNIAVPNVDTSNVVTIREKPGVEWDEEWVDEVSDDYEHMVNRFERADLRISDEDTVLKNIIAKTLPTLRSHMDASRKLENKFEKSN